MKHGFFRAVAAVPAVTPADPAANINSIKELLRRIRAEVPYVDLVVMPELCVTGYTCGDLFHNSNLLEAAEEAVASLEGCPEAEGITLVFGAPAAVGGQLYNCAVVYRGRPLALIPKTYLPGYNEFYEQRWFRTAASDYVTETDFAGHSVTFGQRQLLEFRGVKIGAEICEDLWAPVSPGTRAALAGAEVVVNLSASNDLIGKYPYLCDLIKGQSARAVCAYVYASSGYGESSTDLVFDGKAIIAENGSILARNTRWCRTPQYAVADIDIDAIRRDRMHIGTFDECRRRENTPCYRLIEEDHDAVTPTGDDWTLMRRIDPMPFVPSDAAHLAERCEEIVNIQAAGLSRRLDFTRCSALVVGISGGLDSTLALLVAVRAFDSLGLDRKGIHGVTMPGFGTTGRTYNNALELMHALGVTVHEIPIADAVMQHFSDIGQNPDLRDVTYENSQARERTQILMDLANRLGGMVLGTGDLSELALGWATYNGDHMSMYGVNSSVPKTLVRHLTRYFADTCGDDACRRTLLDIIDTPVSPELLPADANGNIAQKTEDLVGPYELHDFFLYYTLRYGFSTGRIRLMAINAFEGRYDSATVDRWLAVFVRRFFTQQFKRSCMPDGPKVGSVCLSPRGDWRMPSDASYSAFTSQK